MATVYWFYGGTDTTWDQVDNWWSDNPPVTPYGSAPLTNDSVVLLGTTMPTTDPSSALQLLSFDSSQADAGATFTLGGSGNIQLNGSGTTTLGIAADGSTHALTVGGTSVATAIILQGGGVLTIAGSLSVDSLAATDSGSLAGGTLTIGFHGPAIVTFAGSSTFASGTIFDSSTSTATFSGSAQLTGGTLSNFGVGTVSFTGSSQMTGGVADTVAFSGSSSFSGGTISTSAAFHGSSTMTAGAIGVTTFNDSSQQTGGTSGGSGLAVSFTGGAALNGGIVANGSALTIDSTATQGGSVDGFGFTLNPGDKAFSSIVEATGVLPNATTYDFKIGPGGAVAVNMGTTLGVMYPSVSASDAPTAGRTVMWFGSES